MGMWGVPKTRRPTRPVERAWPQNTPHYDLHRFALIVNASRDREIRRDRPAWRATNGRCYYCGEPACVLDHVVPLTVGGSNDDSNLVAACWECNSAKSGNSLVAFREMRAEAAGVWCRFSPAQLAYLARCGIDLPPFPIVLFWGEA